MEIVEPGRPEAAFPFGHVFVCHNCNCRFKLARHDTFDTLTMEGATQLIKLVYVECPYCMASVSERRVYPQPVSEIRSDDGQQAVSIGFMSAELGGHTLHEVYAQATNDFNDRYVPTPHRSSFD